ncbi:tripartite tricarboxylate transporter substrate binding protein [Acidovorax sp.]|uniref:Bug family tripartite tricarboxylate transporter substrate binding protein n=1 Tax=Acidovorax sp. TaxID=1872122 RepID=UPI00262163F0|nr:tripartite tricarboxylate transporter substrate binding protein [Acidovorax sp.]
MTLRTSLASIGLVCAVGLLPVLCTAQDYPSRAIQFIIPSTPGTTGDQLARLFGPKLSQRWNVPVVVENKVGAGGLIGIEAGARASPDGYTFLLSATAFSTLPTLHPQLAYDPIKSFSPVVLLGSSPLVLAVTSRMPVKTVREFIDYAKKQPPGKLNYASPGIGSVHHLTMELFKQQTGLSLIHIPYKGTGGALNDLAAGHVDASIVVLQSVLSLARAGKIRVLAVTGTERVAQFPQVPTLAQAGVPNVVSEAWFGLTAPAGTSQSVIAKMNTEINSLLALSEVKDSMTNAGVEPIGGTPEKLDELVRRELKTWGRVVKKGHITAD